MWRKWDGNQSALPFYSPGTFHFFDNFVNFSSSALVSSFIFCYNCYRNSYIKGELTEMKAGGIFLVSKHNFALFCSAIFQNIMGNRKVYSVC